MRLATGLTHSVALDQMHLLSLTLAGRSAKDLTEFVRKTNYILHGLKQSDRPAPETLFQWLWQQVKRVPILSRITDKVRESSGRSKKRTFEWLWAQIAEELRERRHDMNYDNISKGLKDMPNASLACPSTQVTKVEKAPKPPKTPKTSKESDASALPADAKGGKGKGKRTPCAMHAAGLCRFGSHCRNEHVGDAGSDAAKKAYMKSQEGQGDKGSKGKDGKGKGKDSKGKGKKGKDGASSSSIPSAAAAAAACTVTITEVNAEEVMDIWKSFCEFARKALPALNVFLKVSIPILASVVNSIVENPCIGVEQAAGMLHPTVEDFRNLSLEFIGDTGAAHDIGSLKALADQGFDREMLEPWLKCLDNPVRFSTGGGPQTSSEALRIYAKSVGDLNLHLLKNCPLAMSIGKQVSKGRTFVWEHGKVPFIALDHKKCRVWCPTEHRWYARRVQNDVPIFSLRASGGPQQGLNFNHNKKLYQPAVVAECPESCFCGDCLERLPACVCSTYPEEDAGLRVGDQEIAASSACEVPVEGLVVTETNKEHRRRQHRKDNKRRKWEAMKKTRLVEKGQKKLPRGELSMVVMMRDMVEFYTAQAQANKGKIAKRFEALAVEVMKELESFEQPQMQTDPTCLTASTVKQRSRQTGLKGRGILIELCTEPDSNLGVVGERLNVKVTRCTKEVNNLEYESTTSHLKNFIREHPGIDLWASLPCGPWSQWQYLNAHRYGAEFRKKLAKSRDLSLKLLDRFCELAKCVVEHGGDVHFEWPRHALGWKQAALCQLIRDIGMTVVNFDGCAVGLVDWQGTPFLKKWRVATTNENLAKNLNECRCKHGTDFKHAPITGSNTSTTARYPEIMCEIVFSSLFPDLVFKEVPAMPVCEAAVCVVAQEHVEKEPKEQVYGGQLVIETVDTFATPAELEDDLAPADDEAEFAESRDERLKREAKSLDHITTHAKKNPFCEHCVRGRMLKRYAHGVRPEPSDEAYERSAAFGRVLEADHMFPSEESVSNAGEKVALVIVDLFSGLSMAYPARDRSEESCYNSLKHFGGHRLNGDTGVIFKSDAAGELTGAASRLCWTISPSIPRDWPHAAHVEREVRTLKELCRPAHLQAGFSKKMWPISVVYTAKARAFWSPCVIRKHERGTEIEELKTGKTRWEVCTGEPFLGVKYPLGALVFYRAKSDGMAAPTTRPGLFAGWRIDSGLRYRNVVQVVDYEAVRARAHLHWSPKDLHEKEVFFPPVEYIEFPLSNAAMKALKEMSDPDVEVKKKIYDRSLESGVLPYDIDIDAFPEDTPVAPPRHAYITFSRLLEHGFTKGCPGCDGGHYRHNKACRERFDAISLEKLQRPLHRRQMSEHQRHLDRFQCLRVQRKLLLPLPQEQQRRNIGLSRRPPKVPSTLLMSFPKGTSHRKTSRLGCMPW